MCGTGRRVSKKYLSVRGREDAEKVGGSGGGEGGNLTQKIPVSRELQHSVFCWKQVEFKICRHMDKLKQSWFAQGLEKRCSWTT